MNDELNPQHELASAYLDGVAGDAERTQAESSPEVMGLVASFRGVRAQLVDVPPAPGGAFDTALVAALAEFDTPAKPAVAPVIALAPRRRWAGPLLSAAAAVLLIGAIGVAINSSGGTDSESASMDTSAKVQAADAATETQMASDTLAPMSTIGSINSGGQVALVVNTPEELLALELPMPATVPTGDAVDTTAAAAETTANTTAAGEAPVDSSRTMTSYARPAIGCLSAQQVFLADIQYQGVFAIAARDTVTGVTSAIDDDCNVLVSVGP
jgi:hypothetical protein